MKDSLAMPHGGSFPDEDTFEEKCSALGGDFSDRDYSMGCDLGDQDVSVGISPHEGPYVSVDVSGTEFSQRVSSVEVSRDGGTLVEAETTGSERKTGELGDHVVLF